MKKLAYLFAGMAAFGLCSCSSDEPSNPEGNIAKGDVAYLNVNIIATGNASRATSGDFEYGATNENAVNNAYFYFYDENGNFVTESNTWANGVNNTNTPTENIEVFGKNTVVLEGLTGKGYPKWVVTVLNKPSGIQAKRTIKEMGEQLTNWDSQITDNRFVMSTTSYNGTNNNPNYYATQLTEANFSQQASEGFPNDAKTPVNIYVERLAARVQVSLSITNTKNESLISGKTLYEVPVTIAGAPNGNSGYAQGEAPIAAEKVYIDVVGWNLNATAKQSTLSKQLNGLTDWTPSWNDANNFRSYWGKSTTYGLSGENLKSALNVGNNKYTELTLDFKDARKYCNETTNQIANISTNNVANPNATPTVLLAAKIYNDKGAALDLVNFLGINFTKDGFLRKVLELAKDNVSGYYYKHTEQIDGQDAYLPFDETCVKLVSANSGTGAVKVTLGEKTIYTFNTENPVTSKVVGDVTYYFGTPVEPTSTDALKTALEAVTTNSASNKAIAYTSGTSYYAIPLEHINKPATGSPDLVEGQYGVVRNHIYKLNITKISSLGDGVFDPNNELINPEDPKSPNFYVESQINILSWKVVSQDAEI